MPERISLSEAARRLQVSKQALSKWLAEAEDFPPTVVRGRSLLVDWNEIQAWYQQHEGARRLVDQLRTEDREFAQVRAQAWRALRPMFGPEDLSLMLSDCRTATALRLRARELGVRLD